jgi:hydrogenase maturation factor
VAAHEGIHAMHDPTEGGIATGLREMAEASGLGLRVEASALHRLPVTDKICAPLGIDPLGLISSGCLLIAAEPQAAAWACEALGAAGYPVADIGTFTAERETLLGEEAGASELPAFAVDELAAK